MSSLSGLKSMDRFRALLIMLICALPFIMVALIPQLLINRSVADFVPNGTHGWNDQISNWRQIATFNAAGLNGGYYTIDERPPAAEFSRFYAHGIVFPVLYGMLSRLTGWNYATGLWWNAFFLSLGLAFFMVSARLNKKQCLCLALVYITSWSLHLYTVSMMQEAFHHFGALVFAGIFFHLLQFKRNLARTTILLIILFTLFMGMVRLSWMLLSLPLFLCLIPNWRAKWVIGAFVSAGALTVAVFVISGWLAAPGGNSISTIVTAILTDPASGFDLMNRYIGGNFRDVLLSLGYNLPGLQFIQILILIGAAYFFLIKRVRKRHGKNTGFWLFVVYSLISIIVLSCMVYLSSGFLRIFALPLFICVCLLIAFHEYKLLAIMLAINLIGIGAFSSHFIEKGPYVRVPVASQDIQRWKEEASAVLVYQPDAPSPWCNTILFDLSLYDFRVSLFPAPMGIGWFTPSKLLPIPMKSRYYFAKQLVDQPFLQELTRFSFGGVLYENHDVRAQCLNLTAG